MTPMHGILADLGSAQLHGELAHHGDWITHPRFEPETGRSYELVFSRIPPCSDEPAVIKRVRIDGPTADDWFDLDQQRPLERALYAYAVKAWRPLDGSGAELH